MFCTFKDTDSLFSMLCSKELHGCSSPYFLQSVICICTNCQMSSLVTVLRNGQYPSYLYCLLFSKLSCTYPNFISRVALICQFYYVWESLTHIRKFKINGILNVIAALFTIGKLVYDILFPSYFVK